MFSRWVLEVQGVRRGIGCRIRDHRRSERTQPGRARSWTLESDLRPPTCAFRAGADGGRGKFQTQAHIRWKTRFVFGTRRVLRTWSRECRAYVFLALAAFGAHLPRGRFALKQQAMHHAPPSTPPRWSRNTLATHMRATRQSRKVLQSPVLRVAFFFSADESLSFRCPRTCACTSCFDVLAVYCMLLRFA
jgi:hypothetical protein